MDKVTGIINWIWNGLLQWPVDFASSVGVPTAGLWGLLIKIIVAVAALYAAAAIWRHASGLIRGLFKRDTLIDDNAGYVKGGGPDQGPNVGLAASKDLKSTVTPLLKAKAWDRAAEAYASVNKPKEAAKYYRKAGMRKEAAVQLAKAGKTLKAARLLVKEKDYETAARFFTEVGKHAEAASAFNSAGKRAQAAAAYASGGKIPEAVKTYTEYFANAADPLEEQVKNAEECFTLLNSDFGKSKVSQEQRVSLLPSLAMRFEQAKRYDVAARMYQESRDLPRAAEVFILAGKLQEASKCYKAAGLEKESAQTLGRHLESTGKLAEAAAAYAHAGAFNQAGECFAKVGETSRAGECFERGGDFYRAGLTYAQAARFEDAIRTLQKMPETEPQFDQSRALLGRCFYELHDYAHCAATLDNHLTGKKVDSQNVDYFYMLSLAYEQLGKLDLSRELLYKIRTVNVGFRDVTQRISNISSRISLHADATQISPAPPGESSPAAASGGAPASGEVMGSVEQSLGGRYRLDRELGKGGMGVVYLAKDSQLDRPVALKFLGSMVDNNEEYRQRFIREARTAAKISHPNIVNIYDISASIGKAYIAMEYIEGPNLHKYLGMKKKLEVREAISIVGQACGALAAIHEAGIVHRDIKPDNILLAKGGLVKLTDFGLAKAEDNRMTRTGIVMGTPSYMSPEQVLGKDADPRSDIYSLGLVFHECVVGKTVFPDGDVLERQLTEVPPRPSEQVEGIPETLDALIMKCLEKKPEDRVQSAKELLELLRTAKG